MEIRFRNPGKQPPISPAYGPGRSRCLAGGSLGTGFFPLLHGSWGGGPQDALLFRGAEEFRMEIESPFQLRFLLFDGNAMSVGPFVLPNAGHLETLAPGLPPAILK